MEVVVVAVIVWGGAEQRLWLAAHVDLCLSEGWRQAPCRLEAALDPLKGPGRRRSYAANYLHVCDFEYGRVVELLDNRAGGWDLPVPVVPGSVIVPLSFFLSLLSS
jgi:hypothetical protein